MAPAANRRTIVDMTTKRSNRLMNVAAGLAALAAVASAALAWGPASAARPSTTSTPAPAAAPSTVPAIADPAVSGTDLVPWGSDDSYQTAMQRENQMFASVSNVLKSKHDTAKNTIQNAR